LRNPRSSGGVVRDEAEPTAGRTASSGSAAPIRPRAGSTAQIAFAALTIERRNRGSDPETYVDSGTGDARVNRPRAAKRGVRRARNGRYWARTSDPQLVEPAGLMLTLREGWLVLARLQRFPQSQRCGSSAHWRVSSGALVSTS